MEISQPVGVTGNRMAPDPVDQVIDYHIRTKHHFNQYARSLGYLDWANQPDPFRRYAGARVIHLPLLDPDAMPVSPSYESIYHGGAVPSERVTVRTLSRFFEFALALSAWKRAGESQWALRSNPSSGNLHPTEGYVLLPSIEGLEMPAGLYHYAPKEHALEARAASAGDLVGKLLQAFPPDAFLFGLTSVHWREAWKYGERAFRYCHHDVGHAIGSARIAAATLGWKAALLDACDQHTVASVLGADRVGDYAEVEPEHPDCLMVVWPAENDRLHPTGRIPLSLEKSAVASLVQMMTWTGRANRLSTDHAVQWDLIDLAAEACWKRQAEDMTIDVSQAHESAVPLPGAAIGGGRPAGQIIRQRRSAVAFDAKTSIPAATFFDMLARVMPRAELPQAARPMPWDTWPHDPAVHLMLFVHRVDGLGPGLYFLARDRKKLAFVQQSMSAELTWQSVPDCPDQLPLYWLLEGDARKLAAQVSCHQDIAGDSAFSLGMLVEFEGLLRTRGAWCYPRLFWEAGMVGQVLYLEAEAAGVRATGIGCFFDDPVHEIVALKGLSLQSLYHFTIGGPVEDRRLMTLPPYAHVRSEA
jgi:SagB-type dehydrogenase family enzyme